MFGTPIGNVLGSAANNLRCARCLRVVRFGFFCKFAQQHLSLDTHTHTCACACTMGQVAHCGHSRPNRLNEPKDQSATDNIIALDGQPYGSCLSTALCLSRATVSHLQAVTFSFHFSVVDTALKRLRANTDVYLSIDVLRVVPNANVLAQ